MKKGFTFIITAIAAILFLFLLVLFYFTQIDNTGESRVIASACGDNSEYCLTTPELELLAFLKIPYDSEGTVVPMADALALSVVNRQAVDLEDLRSAIDSFYGGDCVYVGAYDQEEIITVTRVAGLSNCETAGTFNFVTSTVYTKNDLIVTVSVGRSAWQVGLEVTAYLSYQVLATAVPAVRYLS